MPRSGATGSGYYQGEAQRRYRGRGLREAELARVQGSRDGATGMSFLCLLFFLSRILPFYISSTLPSPFRPVFTTFANYLLLLQVEILQLENSLARARTRLGEMRKISYQEE